MKNSRQKKILEIISCIDVETQEELQDLLRGSGYEVTQATVSRDIRELGLVKTVSISGVYKYCADTFREKGEISVRLSGILVQAAYSVDYAKNLVVLKTYTGMASAAGAAVDDMELENVLGSIAGDDTLLVITKNDSSAENLCEKFKTLINGN